jgi:ATP-dependent Clp protease ATP-binding subunit ClpA
MISKDLEICFHNQFVDARSKRHEYITLEHLLVGLLEDRSAAETLRACGANLDELREQLTAHLTQHTPIVPADRQVNTQPTLGFQRTLQRAILHVQSAGKKEVTGADVLVAMFGEKDAHAVYFLNEQGIDRLQVMQCLSPDVAPDTAELDAEGMRQVIVYRDREMSIEVTTRILEDFFLMEGQELAEVLNELDSAGKALCGLYPRQTAEFIVEQIRAYAGKHGLPLRCEAAIQARRPPRSSAQTQQK